MYQKETPLVIETINFIIESLGFKVVLIPSQI